MSKRFKVCFSLWFAVLAISLCCGESFAQESLRLAPAPVEAVQPPLAPAPGFLPASEESAVPAAPIAVVSDEDWVIEITPALKLRSDAAQSEIQMVEHPQDAPQPAISRVQFASEYQRIYDSIPFNRAEYNRNPTYRHDSAMEILTGNARHKTIVKHQPQQVVRPVAQRRQMNPYQFGYLRPALRLNYYRYFPSLNPYLNAYNLSGAF